ncbi:MAG: FkbM family methyltransferase [Halobacteriota archaeon]
MRVVPGDALLFGHRIDFLKIDVEGMEIEVLERLKGR